MAGAEAAADPADEDPDDTWTTTPTIVEPATQPAAAKSSDGNDDTDDIWGVPEGQAPPLAPGGDDAPGGAPARPLIDIETLAALQEQQNQRGRFDRFDLPKVVKTIIVLQVMALAAIFVWRHEIVRWQPQMASFFGMFGVTVNLRGLEFVDVHTEQDSHDGVVVLIVQGAIKNVTSKTVSVPRLRFALRNKSLAELYAWTAPPDKGMLGAGEMLPFRTRLASPPPDGNDVLLRFLIRQDFINGSR